MNYFKLILSMILVFGKTHIAFGQNETDSLSRRKLRKQRIKSRPHYVGIGTGSSFVSFRDFATSPLFYDGIASSTSSSLIRKNEQRESQIGIDFTYAGREIISPTSLTAEVDDEVVGSAKLSNFNFFYTQLYQIPKLSSEKWNVKAGASFMSNWTLRINEGLQNNAVGFENINTLFASAKATLNVSRKKEKQKNFLFIRYKLKPKKRFLSYQLNVAAINSSFRNGFAYLNQSAIINGPELFEEYEFKVFSGYRLNAVLSYNTHLKNGNIITWAYQWDALKTGGDLDKFEMSQHSIRFNFLFRTN